MHPFTFLVLAIMSGTSFGQGVYVLTGNLDAAILIGVGVIIALNTITMAIRTPTTKHDQV